MLLKEFLDLVYPGQKIYLHKGSVECWYKKKRPDEVKTEEFYNFHIMSGLYGDLENKEIEQILLESEIKFIKSSRHSENGEQSSNIYVCLDYISVERLICDLSNHAKENNEEEVRFTIYNKYKAIPKGITSETLNKAEVMFWDKDWSGKYNIFIDECEMETPKKSYNMDIYDNPNSSGTHPNLYSAFITNPYVGFDHNPSKSIWEEK